MLGGAANGNRHQKQWVKATVFCSLFTFFCSFLTFSKVILIHFFFSLKKKICEPSATHSGGVWGGGMLVLSDSHRGQLSPSLDSGSYCPSRSSHRGISPALLSRQGSQEAGALEKPSLST